MRVLVTGASGFVGRWAVAALVGRGTETIAVSRRPAAAPGVKSIACDLLDASAARKLLAEARPDIVLHLAWTVEHGKFWTAPENLDWVGATLTLMRAAADAGVGRFVGVGTCFEYAWPSSGDCEEMATPLAPTTLYAVAKDAVRRVGAEWGGLPFAWARLFYLYGPEEHEGRLVASIAARLARGEPAPMSQGLAERDFMHVRDAGEALAAVALSGVTGPVNIATGEGPTIREIGETLARIAGRPELLRVGALPDRPGDPARIVGSAARLREEAGFSPKFGLLDGLADVYAWHASRVHSAR
jgi:nucleoside-diphosphate-sugar epimerase